MEELRGQQIVTDWCDDLSTRLFEARTGGDWKQQSRDAVLACEAVRHHFRIRFRRTLSRRTLPGVDEDDLTSDAMIRLAERFGLKSYDEWFSDRQINLTLRSTISFVIKEVMSRIEALHQNERDLASGRTKAPVRSAEDTTDPADLAMKADLREAASRIIETFPPNARVIMLMLYIYGVNVTDAAKRLNLTKGYVSNVRKKYEPKLIRELNKDDRWQRDD